MAGGRVYHWKHGWIPLDHAAALKKAHGSEAGAAKLGFAPVSHSSLPRKSHVVATHNASKGTFDLHDTQTGHKASLTTAEADKMQASGASITGVKSGGSVQTVAPSSEPAFLRGRERIQSPNHEKAMTGANPEYDRSRVETTVNCLKSVAAYEMRRRGFDVRASHGTANDNAARAWGTRSVEAGSRQDLEVKLAKAPVGARFAISGSWKGVAGGGHVWAAEKMPDGSIRYFDPQVGLGDASKYFDRLDLHADKGYGVTANRIDNAKIKQTFSKFIVSPGGKP